MEAAAKNIAKKLTSSDSQFEKGKKHIQHNIYNLVPIPNTTQATSPPSSTKRPPASNPP